MLVNGATGAAGQLAVQIAKRFGAAKVIATGRNLAALREAAALGADVTIPLVEDEAALDASFAAAFDKGVDVVVDYLWGRSAERLLIAAAKAGKGAPVRFVQIGSVSGETIALPSAVLRSAPITLMGSGLGSVPPDRLLAAIGAALEAAASGNLKIAAKPVPLSEVEQAWNTDDGGQRIVFTVGAPQWEPEPHASFAEGARLGRSRRFAGGGRRDRTARLGLPPKLVRGRSSRWLDAGFWPE